MTCQNSQVKGKDLTKVKLFSPTEDKYFVYKMKFIIVLHVVVVRLNK